MGICRILIVPALALTACATTPKGGPDLAPVDIAVSPKEAGPGEEFFVTGAIDNVGDAAIVAGAPGAYANVALFNVDTGDLAADLGTWRVADLPAGGRSPQSASYFAPPGLKPGKYYVCVFADPGYEIAEPNENNNNVCTTMSLLSGPAPKADLVIDRIRRIGTKGASYEIEIRVRNAGATEAPATRLMAFRRDPRAPILLTTCAATLTQWESGLPPACGDVEAPAVGAGKSAVIKAFVTIPRSSGSMPINRPPVDEEDPRYRRMTVDILADACHAPSDPTPMPHWCRVRETNEINNFADVRVRTPRE